MKMYAGGPGKNCDLCGTALATSGLMVDGKTVMGPWANMCRPCHAINGVGLGTGKGQLFKLSGVNWLKVEKEKPRAARRKVPSMAQLEAWSMDGVCEATDGCEVEPDGTCEHGKPSWLLKMGLV